MSYQTPNFSRRTFASTNMQTIAQRAQIIQELLPEACSIAELCCGDCFRQWQAYAALGDAIQFLGLDIEARVIAQNKARGIPCIQGDVTNKAVLSQFQNFDVIFFGPPLSHDCDGHHLLTFREIVPSYQTVAQLLLGELLFKGLFVCICPKTTTMGDIRWLYKQIQGYRPDVGLHLIHNSYSTMTGNSAETEARLKYIELWFSSRLGDTWNTHTSYPA